MMHWQHLDDTPDKMKSYNELVKIDDFLKRYEYLKLGSVVAEETFGPARYLNQAFYRSEQWKRIRREVILRDNGFDLGIPGFDIRGKIYIHHIEPITIEDIINRTPKLLSLDNLISVSDKTHNAIHYGDITLLPYFDLVERRPGDTCPWK